MRRLSHSVRNDGPLFFACAALVLFGVVLRAQHLNFPAGLSWDEHHFVLNARNYIQHQHDWNDHPPLGKLFIAAGMLVFGDDSFGWRIVPLLFGLLNVVLARAIGSVAFRDRRAGWIAAAFVACDGFLISYSRTALLDGMLTTFVLLVTYLTLRARSPWQFAVIGLVIGAASAMKMSGVALGIPALLVALGRRRPIASMLALGGAPFVYVGVFSTGLGIAREPHSAWDAVMKTRALIVQQAAANKFTHPLTSHWYTWFLPKRPITIRWDSAGPGLVRVSTTLGNLLLWWTASIVLVVGSVVAVRAAHRVIRARSYRVALGRSRAVTCLFAFALAMLLPWIIGSRDSYMYHYLPTYSVLLVLTGGLCSILYRKRRLWALGYVLAVGLVSAFYAPVWAQLPVTTAAFQTRLFLPMWR